MKKYESFIGKTKKEVLETVQDDEFNDIYSDKWIFYLGKDFWGSKRYLYVFFEANIVVRTSVATKYFWEKNKI